MALNITAPATHSITHVNTCAQCGASMQGESCDERFALLLALDHSRQEPWGSRHGLAFAVYTLQHPQHVDATVLQTCWTMLSRVYEAGDDRQDVVNGLRGAQRAKHGKGYERSNATRSTAWQGAVFPSRRRAPQHYDITIADLGDFEASSYPALLDAWCNATLRAWTTSE